MAEEKPVHEQVQDLLASWNTPPNAHDMERLVGGSVPDGDGRATAAVRPEDMDHDRNPGRDDVDAERMFQDDGGDDDDAVTEDVSYDDMTNDELKDLLRERDLPVSGKHDELVARLQEDDESEDDESEDDDDA
jgi:hypothetical protein